MKIRSTGPPAARADILAVRVPSVDADNDAVTCGEGVVRVDARGMSSSSSSISGRERRERRRGRRRGYSRRHWC